jgi:hypothetical protein
MAWFSTRRGITPPKAIVQVDGMDADLRIGLWNALTVHYFEQWSNVGGTSNSYPARAAFCRTLWVDFFKQPLDKLPGMWKEVYAALRAFFLEREWHAAYDLTEFIVAAIPPNTPGVKAGFVGTCNDVLEKELSGYRLVGGQFTPITSKEEVEAIADAVSVPDSLSPVREHIDSALRLLSDRQNPDYRNSIKESISAVESLCQLIAGERATLGDALKAIEKKVSLHGALKQAFSNLYGYTSDAEGIRHALLDEPTLVFEDAKFMLVSCAAFVNYLVAKAATAGLKL